MPVETKELGPKPTSLGRRHQRPPRRSDQGGLDPTTGGPKPPPPAPVELTPEDRRQATPCVATSAKALHACLGDASGQREFGSALPNARWATRRHSLAGARWESGREEEEPRCRHPCPPPDHRQRALVVARPRGHDGGTPDGSG
jgi:hypothetical protein